MKDQIHQACLERISDEIQELTQAVLALREGISNDTKSSAGDKFETSRAMADHEISKLDLQLSRLNTQLNSLKQLDTSVNHHEIGNGSFVETDKQLFYISIALGKLIISGKEVMIISRLSPIYQAMQGKSAGAVFSFGRTNYVVKNVS